MAALNILRITLDWLSAARAWLAASARARRDAEALASMSEHELRDLGLSHAAAAGAPDRLLEYGIAGSSSWMRAEPRFPRRVAVQSQRACSA